VGNRLYAAGLIPSLAEFVDRVVELGLAGELLDGTYTIPYGLPIDELISRLVTAAGA
jgi:hypothetical protein